MHGLYYGPKIVPSFLIIPESGDTELGTSRPTAVTIRPSETPPFIWEQEQGRVHPLLAQAAS